MSGFIPHTKYDYIIAGGGCAGLSLVLRILQESELEDKKILLIDRDKEKGNDRTWCFWEQQPGFFEEIVYRRWSALDFFGKDHTVTFDISPYQYKMIRGSDFYAYAKQRILQHPQVHLLHANIKSIDNQSHQTIIHLDDRSVDTGNAIVFSSLYEMPPPAGKDIRLLQHFKGWIIRSEKAAFDPARATLMDFRINQHRGTSFVYVLPFDETTALVEFTLFTPALLADAEYETVLADYVQQYLGLSEYEVMEKEFGVIPMTNQRFSFFENGVYHIGTAGGQTKASSGYTFQFIQKQSDQIVAALKARRPLSSLPATPARFRFYDNTLLHILYHKRFPGDVVFTELFKKNEVKRVLRFLDNESSIADELKIISSLPTWPFLKAGIASL